MHSAQSDHWCFSLLLVPDRPLWIGCLHADWSNFCYQQLSVNNTEHDLCNLSFVVRQKMNQCMRKIATRVSCATGYLTFSFNHCRTIQPVPRGSSLRSVPVQVSCSKKTHCLIFWHKAIVFLCSSKCGDPAIIKPDRHPSISEQPAPAIQPHSKNDVSHNKHPSPPFPSHQVVISIITVK